MVISAKVEIRNPTTYEVSKDFLFHSREKLLYLPDINFQLAKPEFNLKQLTEIHLSPL